MQERLDTYTLLLSPDIPAQPHHPSINICFVRLSFLYLFGGFSLFPLLMAVFSLSSSSWCVTHTILRITFLCFINQFYSISLDPFSRNFSVLYSSPPSVSLSLQSLCNLNSFQKQKVEFRYLAIHAFEKSPPTPS